MSKKWLFNKTVVISGASGGLGFSIARRLINEYNCKIIGIARNEKKILSAKQSLGDKSDMFTYKIFDVSVKENWENFALELQNDGIIIDALINNAGFMLPFAKFEKYSDAEIEEITKTNFLSVVYSTKNLMPLLKKSSTPAIINVSSLAGNCAVVGESMYCAVKFAVKGFTQTLIEEYKNEIYICGIYPGFIKTDILNRMSVGDKENSLIQKMMMPVEKASKKIVRKISRKRKNIILGVDGKLCSFFVRLFPRLTPAIVSKVLKTAKLDLFKEVFDKNNCKKEKKS